MNRENVTAFELEKGAVQTEVENGLAGGVKRLHNEDQVGRESHLHNTR